MRGRWAHKMPIFRRHLQWVNFHRSEVKYIFTHSRKRFPEAQKYKRSWILSDLGIMVLLILTMVGC